MKYILEFFDSIRLLLKTYLLNNRFWQQRAWSTHCHCIPVDCDNWGDWLESALTMVCIVIKFQLVHEILDLVGHRLVICSFKGIDKTNMVWCDVWIYHRCAYGNGQHWPRVVVIKSVNQNKVQKSFNVRRRAMVHR